MTSLLDGLKWVEGVALSDVGNEIAKVVEGAVAAPAQEPEFTVNASGGKKQTGGKPLFNQVPEAFVAALTAHMQIGSVKYGHANWCKGMTESQVLEAGRRHYAKRRGGENIDPETKSSHYLAEAANAMMGWCLEQAGKLEDDRAAVYVDSFVTPKEGAK